MHENFTSVTAFVRAVVPRMPAGCGSIINLTSIEAHRAGPGYAVYSAMKAAVENLTKSLALELGARGIRVNCIAPDVIPTPGLGALEAFQVRTPLPRAGHPDDVAGAALFLASDLSRFVTGTTLHVDGGNWAAGGWRRARGRELRALMRAHAIESLDDPRVAAYRNVRDADLRVRDGLFLTEGRLNVKRLITVSPYRTRSVFVTRGGAARDPARARAARRGRRRSTSRRTPLLCAVVGYAMHRGCLAAGERGAEPELAALPRRARSAARHAARARGRHQPENVGAIFRNALALGADGVVLTRRCVDPLYRRSIRVSMGASLRVPLCARRRRRPPRSPRCASAGFTNVALDDRRATRRRSRASGAAPRRLALWLGSEGERALGAACSRASSGA